MQEPSAGARPLLLVAMPGAPSALAYTANILTLVSWSHPISSHDLTVDDSLSDSLFSHPEFHWTSAQYGQYPDTTHGTAIYADQLTPQTTPM